MASLTQCTWVWASSRSWWRTGKPGMLQSMGSQRVGHDWATELNWADVHRVSNDIQPCHPLLFPSPPAFNLSLHQDLFQWVSCSHQVARVLEPQLLHQPFQWVFRVDFLEDWLVISLQPKELSRVFSNTTVREHQFFGTLLSLWSILYISILRLNQQIAFFSKKIYA